MQDTVLFWEQHFYTITGTDLRTPASDRDGRRDRGDMRQAMGGRRPGTGEVGKEKET